MEQLILTFFVVLGFSYANGLLLFYRLRNVHPEMWTRLGQPSIMQSNLGVPRLALMRFVWTFQFRAANDSFLSLVCFVAMVAEVILALIFITLLVRAV